MYVVETASGDGYYSWYDDPWERVVEFHRDATEAIQAGLRRASRLRDEGGAPVAQQVPPPTHRPPRDGCVGGEAKRWQV